MNSVKEEFNDVMAREEQFEEMYDDGDAAYENWREYSHDILCDNVEMIAQRAVDDTDHYFNKRPAKVWKAIQSLAILKLEMLEKAEVQTNG
jgi:hypothetical protein